MVNVREMNDVCISLYRVLDAAQGVPELPVEKAETPQRRNRVRDASEPRPGWIFGGVFPRKIG